MYADLFGKLPPGWYQNLPSYDEQIYYNVTLRLYRCSKCDELTEFHIGLGRIMRSLYFFFLLLPVTLNAQGWDLIYPSLPVHNIVASEEWNGDTLFAAGFNWTIMRSPDRGKSWENLFSYDNDLHVFNMFRAGNELILSVSADTTEAAFGDSLTYVFYAFNPWTSRVERRTLPKAYSSMGSNIYMNYSGRYIMALEESHDNRGAIHTSSDGGKNWQTLLMDGSVTGTRNGRIYFKDQITGFYVAVSNDDPSKRLLYRTDDGGIRWTPIPGTEMSSFRVKWSRQNPESRAFGVATGNTLVFTTDWGNTWNVRDSIPWISGSRQYTTELGVFENGVIIGIGETGLAYRSTDFGLNWTQINGTETAPTYYTLEAMIPSPDEIIWFNQYEGIKYSTDGGDTWTHNLTVRWHGFSNMHFESNTDGFALAYDTGSARMEVVLTSDGGASWQNIAGADSLPGPNLYYISSDLIYCYKTKNYYTFGPAAWYVSYDMGKTWQVKQEWDESSPIYNAWMINAFPDGRILILTRQNGFFESTDNGDTWDNVGQMPAEFDTAYVYAFETNSAGDLYIASHQNLYRSTDNGNTWAKILEAPNSVKYLSRIELPHENTIIVRALSRYIPGEYFRGDVIFVSKNDGTSWDDYESAAQDLHQITTPGTSSFGIGSGFRIYRSDDYWRSAELQLSYNTPVLSSGSLYFFDEYNALAYDSYFIFSTTNGGVNAAESLPVSPEKPHLTSAWPNPAATGDQITFTLTGVQTFSDNVRISVFNVLGMEVAMLFDGRTPAGSRSIVWDTSDDTKGMYFVRLTAGTTTEVHKVVVR